MPVISADRAGGANVCAFLDMLANSELGPLLNIAETDNGYRCIVGSTLDHLNLFSDYSDHPRQIIEVRPGLKSTAAGRYQLLARYFDPYKALLDLPDFGPESQDRIAIQQIKEARALEAVQGGDLDTAIARCAHLWASLPGAGYGQHEQKPAALYAAYINAGGVIS